MGNGKLLVPIHMEALIVTETSEMADLRPDFSQFPKEILGTSFAPDPLSHKIQLEPGVHLHWSLPAELTHGAQRQESDDSEIDNLDKNLEIEFYRAPNRWFVMRIPSGENANQKFARAWILESDYLDENGGANSWLTQDAKGKFFRSKLGKAFEFGTWQECGHHRESKLTAVGPGNPAFAAFYPACQNVFGFHDPLDDLENIDSGIFTYLVAGWYSQPEYDPLNPEGNWYGRHEDDPLDAELKSERLQDLKSKWQLNQKADSNEDYPTSTICHSTIFNVEWKGRDSEYQSGVSDAYINIALGNTATEALSALISARLKNGRKAETLLSAFQYGVLSDSNEFPGVVEIDAEIHRRGFNPVKGGTLWVIQKADTHRPYYQSREGHIRTFPDSEGVAEAFEELNKNQRDFDSLTRELASLQWEYYSTWFKSKWFKGKFKSPEFPIKSDSVEELNLPEGKIDNELNLLEKQIGDAIKNFNTAKEKIESLKEKIEQSNLFKGNNPCYELIETEKPWFWLPNDPVILLAGPGVEPSDKYSQAENPDVLNCRALDQVLSEMGFYYSNGYLIPKEDGNIVDEDADSIVDSKVIREVLPFPQKQELGPTFPADEVQALFYETLLLDPEMAKAIAQQAYLQAGVNEQDIVSSWIEQLAEGIIEVQNNLKNSRFEFRTWKQAWSPLFMVWEAEWSSTYSNPDQFNLAEHWKFVNTIDYKLNREKKDEEEDEEEAPFQIYKGWVPLDPSLPGRLEERLKKVPELAKRFGEWNLSSQSLSGLCSSLIMREQTLQMPPLKDDQTIDNNVFDLIGGAKDCSPMLNAPDDKGFSPFFPVRSGFLRIKNLWIVDAYGQARKVVDGNETAPITVSESFRGLVQSRNGWIPLPPRIMQPARLSFQWLSPVQDKETSSDPSTSPVCGWIVPNHFDKSLMVFDCAGKMQGQLQTIDIYNKTGPVWWKPGSPDQDNNIDLKDPYLLDFVKNLKTAGPEAFTDLLNLIDRISLCITSAVIQQVQGLSVLVGQPLALVRASLKIELEGHPVTNPGKNSTTVDSGDFMKVKFPVYIGDIRKGKDGLVGYFNDNDFGHFRPVFGASLEDAVPSDYLDFSRTIEVGIEQEGPVKVTLLMDPRAGIHVSSGILPTQFLQLPPYVLSEALENMELYFMVGPFIGDPDALRIPLPEDIKGDWSWDYFQDVERWTTNDEVGKKENRPGVSIKPAQIYEGWLTLHNALGDKNEESNRSQQKKDEPERLDQEIIGGDK
ncbi:MAG: hypothetical protein ACMUIU_01830 [bacterium]